jgi:hypothetical protein
MNDSAVYTLMHGNIPVIELSYNSMSHSFCGIQSIINREHLPLGACRMGVKKKNGQIDTGYINDWWTLRGIPASREGIREALELLQVKTNKELMIKGLGLSLSDHYWVRPPKSRLEWYAINYYDNPFSDDIGDALFGKKTEGKNAGFWSPDVGSNGNLRKKWKIRNGKRVLIKGGSRPFLQEPFNESIASMLLKRLDIAHVPYTLEIDDTKPYSVCENFTDQKAEFISAWDIFNSLKRDSQHSDFQHYLKCCDNLGIPGVKNNLDIMLGFDFLIANSDRHYYNFGALRNPETLEWLGPAPLFDCGSSLWYDLPDQSIDPSLDMESKPFRTYHSEQIMLVKSLEWFKSEALYRCDEEYEKILEKSPLVTKERRDSICKALNGRLKALESIAVKQGMNQYI